MFLRRLVIVSDSLGFFFGLGFGRVANALLDVVDENLELALIVGYYYD